MRKLLKALELMADDKVQKGFDGATPNKSVSLASKTTATNHKGQSTTKPCWAKHKYNRPTSEASNAERKEHYKLVKVN